MKVYVLDLQLTRAQKAAAMVGLGAALSFGVNVSIADVPNEFAPSQVLTAAALNDNFASVDARLAALAAPKTRILAEVGGTFSIPNQTFTVVPYTDPEYDDLGEFDADTHQFTPNEAGDYLVCASLFNQEGGGFELDYYQNGSRVDALAFEGSATNGLPVATSGCAAVRLAAGDALDIRAHQGGGTTVLTGPNTHWSWLRISRL